MIERNLEIVGTALPTNEFLDDLLRKHECNDFLGAIGAAERYFQSVQELYTPLTLDSEPDTNPTLQIVYIARVAHHNASVFPFVHRLMAAEDALSIIVYLRTKDLLESDDVLQLYAIACQNAYYCCSTERETDLQDTFFRGS